MGSPSVPTTSARALRPGAALGVQEGLDHLDGVEGALAEGAHGLGGAEEGRVVAIVGHLIEVGHGLLQLAGRDAERGLKLRDGGGGDDLILKAGRDAPWYSAMASFWAASHTM